LGKVLNFDRGVRRFHSAAMESTGPDKCDSQGVIRCDGGFIPGLDEPSFSVLAPGQSRLPVVIAVPHGGRRYPPEVLARLRHPEIAALRLEDRLVDRLGRAAAQATGAALVLAHAPRAMLDLNRAEDDVDWDMLGIPAPKAPPANGRARSGLGLVPRRLPGMGDIWRGRLSWAEVEARIAGIHAPYHTALAHILAQERERWGAVLLIDLHSMPPLPRITGQATATIVVGDRFGAACHGALVASTFSHFAGKGVLAAHNRPYAGGFALDRHGAPRFGTHAMQLEIDRAAYLDSGLVELGDGFGATAGLISSLILTLGAQVAAMGGKRSGDVWPEAAE